MSGVKDVVELLVRPRKEKDPFLRHRLINILRIVLEQNAEWQTSLNLAFINFEKTFDSLNRRAM